MTHTDKLPLFSVIIPTRNRSSLFAVALQSVLEQHYRGFEVIITNDGSSAEHEQHYRTIVSAAHGAVRMLSLVRTINGHGPGYARNYAADYATGAYLCFLDDDDQWTDAKYLECAANAITSSPQPVDLLLSNQQAFQNGAPATQATWLESLTETLPNLPDAGGAYTVTPVDLLRCQAHCHLNTTIVSRAFFLQLGGLDEGLRYEEDRDFYLRAIDRAELIKYLPVVVSRHNIPDPAAKANLSTAESELSKRLYQLRVFDKAVLFSSRPELRRYAMRQRTYILKHIAMSAARIGRFDSAAYYAREALMTGVTLGWLGATALFTLRRACLR